MKPQIKCVLLVFLLIISITACSSNKSNLKLNNSSSSSSNRISDTSVPISPSSTPMNTLSDSQSENNKNDLVLEAYKTVLQNKVNFFSVDYKKKIYLNDFLNEVNPGYTLKVTHFTVLDMDGDKIPEVVLELADGNDNPIYFEILHYMNGAVYGYNIVYRGLEQLKTDGTAWGASSAWDIVCGKQRFKSNAYETDILGYSKSSQNNDGMTIAYFINNKPVTKKAFDSFSKEQNAKKDAVWYEFSQNNIETKLSDSLRTKIDDKVKVKEESKKQEYITNLDNIEIGLKDLDKKDSGTTLDMREAANERYKRWDTSLNEIYNVLKGQLSSSDIKKLQSEQIQWISNRDAKAKKASLEMKAGTMEPVLYTGSLADTTKIRCYELVEKYIQ